MSDNPRISTQDELPIEPPRGIVLPEVPPINSPEPSNEHQIHEQEIQTGNSTGAEDEHVIDGVTRVDDVLFASLFAKVSDKINSQPPHRISALIRWTLKS